MYRAFCVMFLFSLFTVCVCRALLNDTLLCFIFTWIDGILNVYGIVVKASIYYFHKTRLLSICALIFLRINSFVF